MQHIKKHTSDEIAGQEYPGSEKPLEGISRQAKSIRECGQGCQRDTLLKIIDGQGTKADIKAFETYQLCCPKCKNVYDQYYAFRNKVASKLTRRPMPADLSGILQQIATEPV